MNDSTTPQLLHRQGEDLAWRGGASRQAAFRTVRNEEALGRAGGIVTPRKTTSTEVQLTILG